VHDTDAEDAPDSQPYAEGPPSPEELRESDREDYQPRSTGTDDEGY
jgi:hypothetical protein